MGRAAQPDRPVFVDDVPAIDDGPLGAVKVDQGDGSLPVLLMPFDKFTAFVFAGMRYIKKRQSRQEKAVAGVVSMPRRKKRLPAH